jgi:cellulose synthase (UDP-forming)
LVLEGTGGVSTVATLVFGLFRTDRLEEANLAEVQMQLGEYEPSVDVIIPTYNEPAEILRRTVVGCQAMEYGNFRVYLLDDLRRPEIRELARELGCDYRDRPDNAHAKAGNVNHALPSLGGELLAVFDADYVPSRSFLRRTIGLFLDAQVSMVQTPQNFFNEDPVTVNLGLEGVLNNEQNFFFRYIQPSRDAWNAVICCGSCFVVRRQHLDEIGGIPTDSIAEDMFTSIHLQARGYRIKYLNENLSAGMSAENTTAYTNQRLRWGRGTLQSIFCSTNVFSLPGLNWGQRLYHGMSLLYWIQSLPRALGMLLPLLQVVFGINPIHAELAEVFYIFVPFHLANVMTFSWLSGGWRSVVWSEIYDTLLCVPTSLMVFDTMRDPFGKGFKVTPKGVASEGVKPNWDLLGPLVALGLANGVSIVVLLWRQMQGLYLMPVTYVGMFWAAYNLVLVLISALAAIDVPQRRHPRFGHGIPCRLWVDGVVASGRTVDLSEGGAKLLLEWPRGTPMMASRSGQLELLDENLGLKRPLQVQLRWGEYVDKGDQSRTLVGLKLEMVPVPSYRRLIDFLYCEPGQWPDVKVPEYRTLGAFGMALLRLHPFSVSRS